MVAEMVVELQGILKGYNLGCLATQKQIWNVWAFIIPHCSEIQAREEDPDGRQS